MDKLDIIYTTPQQQIEKLKQQNLIIQDEDLVKKQLQIYGYSNLIKSYRDPYFIAINDKKMYRSGVTFEQISSLYTLDKALRNSVMAAMQDLEEHIKEVAADVVASSFGVHQNQYLQQKNYRDKRRRKSRFSLSNILDTMRKTLDTDKDPIRHYAQKYGLVPPWILFKSIYFSTIINFISLFKKTEQEEMVKRLYATEKYNISLESYRKLMMDTLFICTDYRNKSAHGGRIYNYISDKKLRYEEIFEQEPPTDSGFGQLLFLLHLFKYQNPYHRLHSTLNREVSRHCNMFPQDETYLAQILQINIVAKEVVYISSNSKKYHSKPHCSGITNVKQITLDSIDKNIYSPCKRCCP